jgi:hypothetical protein
MLAWPAKAKKAMSVFFVKWNDIDIYVEDTAKSTKSLYVALINNALNGKCKVTEIFPLGDRKSVIDACRADQLPGGRPRIYLIDGDLDLIAGVRPPSLTRLFAHHVYALENYLFCKDALTQLLHEENSKLSLEEVEQTIDFSSFFKDAAVLQELFIVFGLTRIFDPSLPTISLGIGQFLNRTQNGLDAAKVKNFCSSREQELLKVTTKAKLQAEEKKMRDRILKLRGATDVIAAREFLFPYFQIRRAAVKLKISASKDTQQMRLAKTVDLTTHRGLISALTKAAIS